MSGPQTGTGQDPKPHPSGLMCLLPGDEPPNLIDHPCLQLEIDGFRIRMGWKDVQPSGDSYVTDALDQSIAIAAEHGKKVGVNIAGNIMQPNWGYGIGTDRPIFKYAYLEQDRDTGASVGNTPLIWDTEYQALAETFIRWMGKRYDSNPHVAYIMATHFMQICPMYYANDAGDEAYMNDLAQNPPTGFPGLNAVHLDHIQAYIPAACHFIDLWMKAFKATPVMVTICPPFPSEAGQQAQNDVKNYGLQTYPGRFGTFVAARYAEAGTHPADPVSYPKGSQFAYNAEKQAQKQWKKPAPDPIPANPATFIATIDAACSKADKFVECYEVDLVENEAATLADARAKLKAMA